MLPLMCGIGFFFSRDLSLPFRNWLCDGSDHPLRLLEAELRGS